MQRYPFTLVIIFFVVLGIVGGLFFTRDIPAVTGEVASVAAPAPTPTPTPTPTPRPVVALPELLSIPKLGVRAFVEEVGEDINGRMDVPKEVNNVGWYNRGYRPGEQGSAVIAGHYDTATGAPAVFYYLNQLTVGDEITVTDQNGKVYTFQVVRVANYPYNQVPLQEIFDSRDKQRLNLITCAGVWNAGSRNYSERTIVYTELKG